MYELTPGNVENFPRPSISERWQKELTRIVGKNDYDKPMVRLVWGPEETRVAFGQVRKRYLAAVLRKMTHWEERTSSGQVIKHPPSGTCPETIPMTSIVIPIYESKDIGKPRWFLEEWWPPELTVKDWEANRYEWIGGVRTDVLGPSPREGQYRPFKCIQTEDNKYREPNESDLEEVKYLLQMRDAEKKEFGNRELQNDKEAIAELAGKYAEQIKKRDKKASDEFEEMLRESIRPHIDKLVKNPEATWGGK